MLMTPVKLAGEQLMMGAGCLAHLATLKGARAMIVTGGSSMDRAGVIARAEGYLHDAGMETTVYRGVPADPMFSVVQAGAKAMLAFEPDWIVAIGGGSPMDAAKAMWVLYEHPELTTLDQLKPPNPIPPLRRKAKFCCVPSTSGSASEVSRSIVITEDATGMKCGIGDMEMMPDVAICDPEVTLTLPPHLTAETGMDAMTHALEAYVSRKAHYLSDVLARQAALDIYHYLPLAYKEGGNIQYRDMMMNASTIAGLAFTNVSLGIVHSMAHVTGSYFGVAHGLADAIILPYVVEFNTAEPYAKAKYESLAAQLGEADLAEALRKLNRRLDIAPTLTAVIPDKAAYEAKIPEMCAAAAADGCTGKNPILPTPQQFDMMFRWVYTGQK